MSGFGEMLCMVMSNRCEQGQGLVEYALILVLVAIVVIGILTLLGPQIGNIFSRLLEPAYCGECLCGTSICDRISTGFMFWFVL
jgi:pilus assembly protein Flp/PilA